jgi:hypothetical protein
MSCNLLQNIAVPGINENNIQTMYIIRKLKKLDVVSPTNIRLVINITND